MFALFTLLMIISLVIIGWGMILEALVERVLGRRLELSFFSLGMAGVAGAYLFFSLFSLLFPLGGVADWVFAALGFGAYPVAWWRKRLRFPAWPVVIGVSVTALVLGYGSMHTPLNFDAGLYHLQVLKYLERDPVSFGLANIHDRFGFNVATNVLAALLNGPVFGARSGFLLSGVFLLLMSGLLMERIQQMNSRVVLTSVFAAFVLVIWTWNLPELAFSWFSLGPNGDVPAAVLTCVAMLAFLWYFEASSSHDDAQADQALFLLPILCIACVAVKISQAPILLLAVVLLFQPAKSHPVFRAGLMVGCIIAVVWVVHGVILSGCLLFPVRASCVSFLPWSVTEAAAVRAAEAIIAWARAPGARPEQVLQGFGWIDEWTTRMLPHRTFLADLLAAGFLMLITAFLIRLAWPYLFRAETHALSTRSRAPSIAFFIGVLGMAAWFLSAPDPRFAIGFLISAPGMGATWVLAGCAAGVKDSSLYSLRVLAAGAVAIGLASATYSIRKEAVADLPWNRIPKSETRTATNGWGVEYRVPLNREQCLDEEALCSPGENARLRVTSWLGRPMYQNANPPVPARKTPELPTPPSGTKLPVQYAPEVWGSEEAQQGERRTKVRWLQKESSFSVRSPVQQKASIAAALASHGPARKVWLRIGGEKIQADRDPSREYWSEGPAIVKWTVHLRPGENQITLVSDGDLTQISPGRSACLLLEGDIQASSENR